MAVCEYVGRIENNEEGDFDDMQVYKSMPNGLPVINNLSDLVRELNYIFESDHVNIELVHYVMKSYKSNPQDWKKFAKFNRYR